MYSINLKIIFIIEKYKKNASLCIKNKQLQFNL
ncbi:hypothetical protein BB2000_1319 [Proteus mirabilis BB2000]|nr:hypothetical protein BB2000_1319 [Proteus mirabilis BB2000]